MGLSAKKVQEKSAVEQEDNAACAMRVSHAPIATGAPAALFEPSSVSVTTSVYLCRMFGFVRPNIGSNSRLSRRPFEEA